MAYQALYRKYRPKNFDDFIDQDNVKRILVNSIKNNKISHAYLFAGPRGIGKTSMAKIFAKAVNCMEFEKHDDVCDECENCLECNENSVDIIEIDAASNNGVDQIRDLKNKISIVPSVLKYKVYIVDEVHMLTNSAFNALLKTLEEPPGYVIFILATTEFYEVPETIVSRCQCFNFSRISLNSLMKRLRFIADSEKIKVDDDTLREIAEFSNGGLRDAIGVLDKLNSFTNGNIKSEDFKAINNLVSNEDIKKLYTSIVDNDKKEVLSVLEKVNLDGYDFKNLIERLMVYIRDNLANNINDNKDINNIDIKLVSCLNDLLIELKQSLTPYIISQVRMLDFMINNFEKSVQCTPVNLQDQGVQCTTEEPKIISREIKKEESEENSLPVSLSKKKSDFAINEEVRTNLINNALASANKVKKEEFVDKWKNLDSFYVDKKYAKMAQLLSDTFPMVVGNEYMILTTEIDAIMQNIYKKINLCEELINKLSNDNIRIVIVLNDEFNAIKDKYVKDLKAGNKYEVIDEKRDLIEFNNGDLVTKALDVFGKDIVEIE
jgi:DNA polymerase-3 subunit gamma/tau